MKINPVQRGKYLLIKANGRLDASWAEYFTDALLLQIRQGQHHLVLDASEIVFLSSAGIRALLLVHKELKIVHGTLSIVNSTSFVTQILSTSGFQAWLKNQLPDDMPATEPGNTAARGNEKDQEDHAGIERFSLNKDAMLTASKPSDWRPWQAVDKNRLKTLSFSSDSYFLGIGSPADTFDDTMDRFGEFLAVAGNIVYQPPDEQAPPDFLITEKQYIPRMQTIQALGCNGEMGQLFRFAPTNKTPFYSLSALLRNMLEQTDGKAAGFVILGEIEGLVGTALIRSPGLIRETREIPFPEIRDWLTFCGERSHARQLAILTGVVSSTNGTVLHPIPSAPGMGTHVHAAVFPYQPLQNGKIELGATIGKIFNGPPPLAVMHLADDGRSIVGLGESALIRGACWFGPLQNPEVLS